jgi:tetratricopeptide (TPR) repeat protein
MMAEMGQRLVAAGLATLLLATAPARAEELRLDAGNLTQLALVMLDSQRPAQALAMAEALLKRNPKDAGALSIRSRALRDLGRYSEAVAAGKEAWAAAATAGLRYDAAMVTAQALASGGSKYRAQFWLRRAVEVAPDDGARRAAERDFNYVRSRSRLWLKFDASIQPSNNVNNGSASNILWYQGFPLVLSGDAQALSGTEAALGVTLKYRLAETEQAKTDLRVSLVQTSVALSGEAKAQAPGARGSDYNYGALELGLERQWRPFEKTEAFVAGSIGHNWYGGDALSNYVRLDLGLTKAMSKDLSLKGSLSLEHQDRLDSPMRSSDLLTLAMGVTARTKQRDRIDVVLSWRDTVSDSVEIEHERLKFQLDWTRARPVLGARFSLGLWAETRDYPMSRYAVGGRTDSSLGAEALLAFDKIDYMGFVPVVTLSGTRTDSNISLYDSETLGVGFSIRSAF